MKIFWKIITFAFLSTLVRGKTTTTTTTLFEDRINYAISKLSSERETAEQKVEKKNCEFWTNLLRLHLKCEQTFCKESLRANVSETG
jgi:hypothetical protein